MQITVLQDKPLEQVEKLLMGNGKMQVLSGFELKQIPEMELRLFCHKHGVYGIPSIELLNIIREHLVPGKSIEVGGGNGVFGRELGIPSTDSMIQNTPEMRAYYSLVQQPVVEYGEDVINLEASEAIDKYQPEVVFGSWVTQYVSPLAASAPPGGGSTYGLRESEFLPKIKKYIIYGNDAVHGQKEIFNDKRFKVERIYDHSNFYSRASKPELNCLYIVTHV